MAASRRDIYICQQCPHSPRILNVKCTFKHSQLHQPSSELGLRHCTKPSGGISLGKFCSAFDGNFLHLASRQIPAPLSRPCVVFYQLPFQMWILNHFKCWMSTFCINLLLYIFIVNFGCELKYKHVFLSLKRTHIDLCLCGTKF